MGKVKGNHVTRVIRPGEGKKDFSCKDAEDKEGRKHLKSQ
jgi:hypothetical protein